jgi:hypothetical protein
VIIWPLRYWYELIALFGREKSSLSDQYKKIDTAAFRSDLLELPLVQDPADDGEELMEQYDRGLASLLDNYSLFFRKVLS